MMINIIRNTFQLTNILKISDGVEFVNSFLEVDSLGERFVNHRAALNGKPYVPWKSLGLRTWNGDETATESLKIYNAEAVGNNKYINTPLYYECKSTKAIIESFVNVDKCQRIRFMLFDPGCCVLPHRDTDNEIGLITIGIINPSEGCDLVFGCNMDGSLNSFSQSISMLFCGIYVVNVGSCHMLRNESDKPIYIIIIEGVPTFAALKKASQRELGWHQDDQLVVKCLNAAYTDLKSKH